MTCKIDDIKWDEMPNGSVEFALENEDYIACWYNENGEFSGMDEHSGWHVAIIDPEDPEDNRERYKVIDYHPSATNLTMSDADKVENFLKELSELTNKHEVVIRGCGCHGSPSLHLEDFVDGGCLHCK